MADYNINELVKFANILADSSGKVIRKYYRNFGSIDAKFDASPVTIADREAETAIRNLIKQQYPEHAIQGEEFGLENEGAKFRWVIDPIDGTTSFMIGRPTFGTLIALTYDGKPIIGIIDQPINNERWVGAQGQKTTFNGKEISVRKCAGIENAILATTGPNYFSKEKLAKFNNIASKTRYTIYGGDCYSYGLLAMGMVDVVVESGLKPHDFLALQAVVEGAGGIATDWSGKALDMHSNGNVLFAGDKEVYDGVLGELG